MAAMADHQGKKSDLYFRLDERPPLQQAFVLGFQIAMTNVFFIVSIIILIGDLICADGAFVARLFATSSVMAGVCTILQTVVGVRLPIFQGPAILFIYPYLDAKSNPLWRCNEHRNASMPMVNETELANNTDLTGGMPWIEEWRTVQGAMILASLSQVIVGIFGLGGFFARLLGPNTLTAVFALLVISLHSVVATVAEVHWGVAAMSNIVMVIFSQYMQYIKFPIPILRWRKRFTVTWYPLFQMFPILLCVLACWFISFILTVCGAFTDDPSRPEYQARTDYAIGEVAKAPAFIIPYPGQFGAPSFRVKHFMTLLIVMMSVILDSIGDYIQTSRPCDVPLPPPHAVNRGLFIEGLNSILSGFFGAGHATTSYSGVIGLISMTKVASRFVMCLCGVILILVGICGKLGALLVSVPKPVLAGPMYVCFSMVFSSALSNLVDVDLLDQRNLSVMGLGIMGGMYMPIWVQEHPGCINTGVETVDMLLTSLLGTPFLFGGSLTCFLDLTLPGKRPKKGLKVELNPPKAEVCSIEDSEKDDIKRIDDDSIPASGRKGGDLSCYDLPYVTRFTNRFWFVRYIPILTPPPRKGKHVFETAMLNSAANEGVHPDTDKEVSIPLEASSLIANKV